MNETTDGGGGTDDARVVRGTKESVERAIVLLKDWKGHLLVDRTVTALDNVQWILTADFTYGDLSIKLTVRGDTDDETFSALVDVLEKIL